ncbi:putative metal-dependent hydrolase [Staphylococcus xylosus]|uniref:Putative metal-dependent hydrolase n=1 Tax=Staphylococcus xylosus TaxID=1288 RepID=A0A5R9B1S4_STAXY|nr:putative metal-dependent hydrolase [Staphylococcus xylosus]MBM6639272.1 putative metal-dependent hydrolase [Staphylococcus xylosus]MCE7782341.1 putative metal-dependent hydrolase [Staphylococcus xylosus]MDO5515582.1 putative metal-dependent hydrolase [Staphylococcus xylosus]MDW8554966.1 putative metal-dependent hydrolase [Staphylococcus xylosus]MEB6299457.1 putative metal-dependent hydrolase [Staphylococcus xylosus]
MDVRFPIGKLGTPENVTLGDVQKWLAEIDNYTRRLRDVVENITEEELNKTYRDGSWNVRQLVHHIADSQLNMYQRLKLALTDNNPTVPPFNQEEWVELEDSLAPIEYSLQMLDGINARIVALGNHIDKDQLERKFTLKDSGEITVATKLAKLAWHENHHLAHIEIALSR